MKCIAVLTLALAAACAQNFDLEEQHSTTFWSVVSRLEEVEAGVASYTGLPSLGALEEQLLDLEDELSNSINGLDAQVSDAMESRFKPTADTIVSSVTSATASIHANVDQRIATIVSSAKAAAAEVEDAIAQHVQSSESKVSRDLDALEGDLSFKLKQLKNDASVAAMTAASRLQSTSKMVDETASAAGQASSVVVAAKNELNEALTAAQKEWSRLAYPTVKGWSGGCHRHCRTDGWCAYCHTRTEYNTIGSYLTLSSQESDSRFTVKKAGYFRVVYFGIGQRHWNHIGLWVNGNHRHHGHQYTNGNWHDIHMDLTWKMEVGDHFYVNVYGSGHGYWNYHSWNSGGAHSRLQVFYVGALE